MSTNVPNYSANMDRLRDEIADLLQPRDDSERELVQYWRDHHGVNTLVTIRDMADRAVQRHIVNDRLGELVAKSYELGYNAGKRAAQQEDAVAEFDRNRARVEYHPSAAEYAEHRVEQPPVTEFEQRVVSLGHEIDDLGGAA